MSSPGRGPGGDATRAPRVLWASLAALSGAYAAFASVPTMAGWGFNLHRFVHPAVAWGTWTLAALALVPPLARRALPWASRAGDALVVGARPPLVLAASVAVALLLQPDRVHLVGDYLLRAGSAERALSPAALYPQALPLDVLLHYELPRALARGLRLPVELGQRVLGAIEGGILAWLAVALVRALGLRGAAALGAAVVVIAGGFLGLFTGYGKAVAEITLLTVAVAAFGVRALSDARALLPLGICFALGMVLHRSALFFAPAVLAAFVLSLRGTPGGIRRARVWLAIAIPFVTLALMLPRIVATALRFDPVHLAPAEVALQGGPVRAALSGRRLLDLVNVTAIVSPLALAAPALAWGRGSALRRDRAAWIAGALAMPWLALALVMHPSQGVFRDWDNFGPMGAACSVLVATLLAPALRDRTRWEWLGLAAALAALAPAERWLAHHADVDRGIARAQAFLEEPPARGGAERGSTWDWIGIRAAQLARWDLAARALAKAAETSPSPRVLTQWGLAEKERGNERMAQDLFRRVTTITPQDPGAWYRLAASSWRLDDFDECLRATLELRRLRPGDPLVAQMLDDLQRLDPTRGPSR